MLKINASASQDFMVTALALGLALVPFVLLETIVLVAIRTYL